MKSIKCINELRESAEKENDSFLLNHSDRSKSKKEEFKHFWLLLLKIKRTKMSIFF